MFKILILRHFLSKLDDISTQCSPVWFVLMLYTNSRTQPYDVIDDVITQLLLVKAVDYDNFIF